MFTYQYKSTKRGGAGVILHKHTYHLLYNDDVVCQSLLSRCCRERYVMSHVGKVASFEVKGFHATEEGLLVINTRRPRTAVHTKGAAAAAVRVKATFLKANVTWHSFR